MFNSRIIVFFLVLFFTCELSHAQKFVPYYSKTNRMLLLDVSTITGFKRMRYTEGSKIWFSLKQERTVYKEQIFHLSDSSFDVRDMRVPLDLVAAVYRDNSNFLTRMLSKALFRAGAAYLVLDVFNNTIHHEKTIVDTNSLIGSCSLMVVGWTWKKLMVRKYKIGKRVNLKILDISV